MTYKIKKCLFLSLMLNIAFNLLVCSWAVTIKILPRHGGTVNSIWKVKPSIEKSNISGPKKSHFNTFCSVIVLLLTFFNLIKYKILTLISIEFMWFFILSWLAPNWIENHLKRFFLKWCLSITNLEFFFHLC